MELNTPISQVGNLGRIFAKKLKRLGLETVKDLLFYYPFRYDDYSNILSISDLKSKKSGTIKGKIKLIANHRTAKKKMIITEAIICDESDSIKCIWFNQPFLTKILKPGTNVYLSGRLDYDKHYGLQLLSPSYEIVRKQAPIHTGRLVPIYPVTAGLSQKQIRSLIRKVIPLAQKVSDWLPRFIKTKYNLINLTTALEQIHFPFDKNWLEKAKHRLKFDELFLLQIKTQLIRQKIKEKNALSIRFKSKKTQEFVKNLPFKLTNAQRKCAWEIIRDIEKNQPMNRLLEGDVGSGKTVVAVIAILNVALNKYQTAYMTPTEILAQQQFQNISEMLKQYEINIALLTRGISIISKKGVIKKSSKKELIEKIKKNEIDVVIGTHTLIQKKIKFANLAFVIIDEQHRFGVEQRAKLIKQTTKVFKQKNFSPHFLSMTATPIPRSLALTVYGDLDISIIDELPKNRKTIITKIVKHRELKQTYQFIREEIKKGRQAFVICPLIDPSDKLGVKSVKEEYEKLKGTIFPDLNISILHGKLKAKEKEKIMKEFLENKINILISTTVVEVGIDIPNASIMFVEGADRFGLAQLYQLRGRVGRSKWQSYCFLVPENPSEKARKRLNAVLKAKNGLELAELDLKMRGPGEIFGTEQSGYLESLKIAKLSDIQIIKETQEVVKNLSWNTLEKKYPELFEKIRQEIKISHLD
ncbi:ATP-dependent DNA helicase RecG [bacterium]|nr:ATP-dependent DNA helicase RecG [bacterium]